VKPLKGYPFVDGFYADYSNLRGVLYSVPFHSSGTKISTLLPMQFRVGREEIGFDYNIVVNGFSGFSGERNLKLVGKVPL